MRFQSSWNDGFRDEKNQRHIYIKAQFLNLKETGFFVLHENIKTLCQDFMSDSVVRELSEKLFRAIMIRLFYLIKTFMNDESLMQADAFVDEILKKAGVYIDGQDVFNETIRTQFQNEMMTYVGIEIMKKLPNEKFEEAKKLSESGETEKLQTVLTDNIDNYEEVIQDIVGEFAGEYIARVKEASK